MSGMYVLNAHRLRRFGSTLKCAVLFGSWPCHPSGKQRIVDCVTSPSVRNLTSVMSCCMQNEDLYDLVLLYNPTIGEKSSRSSGS